MIVAEQFDFRTGIYQHANRLAFDFGIGRLAMRKHGVTDVRLLFENDLRFLRQF